MKKYIVYNLSVIVSIFLPVIIWLGLVTVQMGGPTESSRWVYECYQVKDQYASSISTPKIVIVGGSNALFGLRAQILEDELGIPTVNMATHAGLDIEYLLYHAKKSIKPGDTVIMPLEYELYNYRGKPRQVAIDYVFARDPQYLRSLSLSEVMVDYYFGVPLQRVVAGLLTKLAPPDRHFGEMYTSTTLNINGDELRNQVTPESKTVLRAPSSPALVGANFDSRGIKIIQDFILWCKNNQVRLIATYPNLMDDDRYHSPESKAAMEQLTNFYLSQGIETLGNPYDFLYPPSFFYDTHYHLNNYGSETHTKKIAALLSMRLNGTNSAIYTTKQPYFRRELPVSTEATPLQLNAIRSRITLIEAPEVVYAGRLIPIKVRVENIGNEIWPALGQQNRIHLVYKFVRKDGSILVKGQLSRLPYDLLPGKSIILEGNLAPLSGSSEGQFIIDIVQENITWFGDVNQNTVAHYFPQKVEKFPIVTKFLDKLQKWTQ